MENQPNKKSGNDEKSPPPREPTLSSGSEGPFEFEVDFLDSLEVCRLESDDLADPLFAPLAQRLADDPEWEEKFHRVKRSDARLLKAFHDVPIPEGLEGRLLAAVSDDRVQTEIIETKGLGETVDPSPAPMRQHRSRRRLFAILGSLAVVAATVIAMFVFGEKPQRPFDKSDIFRLAIVQFDDDISLCGQEVDLVAPPQDYLFSPEVKPIHGMRWRWVNDFLGHKAVAYDMSLPNGTRATLYVERRVVPGLPTSPPLTPKNSEQRTVAAWQSGDLLYVMVVNGGPQIYKRLLRSLGPMA